MSHKSPGSSSNPGPQRPWLNTPGPGNEQRVVQGSSRTRFNTLIYTNVQMISNSCVISTNEKVNILCKVKTISWKNPIIDPVTVSKHCDDSWWVGCSWDRLQHSCDPAVRIVTSAADLNHGCWERAPDDNRNKVNNIGKYHIVLWAVHSSWWWFSWSHYLINLFVSWLI